MGDQKVFTTIIDVQQAPGEGPRFIYHAVMFGARADDNSQNYSSDHYLDLTKSLNENCDALIDKVLQENVARGYKMSAGDIIPHGLPTARDAASAADKTNGITSNKDAVAIEATQPVVDTKPVGLMASLRDRFTSMWG